METTIEINETKQSILGKSVNILIKTFVEPRYCQECGVSDNDTPISANGYCKACSVVAFYDTWR